MKYRIDIMIKEKVQRTMCEIETDQVLILLSKTGFNLHRQPISPDVMRQDCVISPSFAHNPLR